MQQIKRENCFETFYTNRRIYFINFINYITLNFYTCIFVCEKYYNNSCYNFK